MNTKLRGNYITNLSLQHASGGWNGMNAALHSQLINSFELRYVGPINPSTAFFERWRARIRKTLGLETSFYFFSDNRLHAIAKKVAKQSSQNAHFNYFHGITPWINCPLLRPTFAYTDACFLTYCDTFHPHYKFNKTDIDRIVSREKLWLKSLTRVYFSSRYAMEECRRRYHLSDRNFECVGLGASIATPYEDQYKGGYKIVFIAVDFIRKGGEICIEAFQMFRRSRPDATLTLIGARPPSTVLELPGVTWTGFLSKEKPEQLKLLQSHYASAFALLLPTVSDMTPLVLAEAALHGCPTIAPCAFGIPEMIQDRKTGRLLDTPPSAKEFANALQDLCNNHDHYLKMRQATREYALERFLWKRVASRIAGSIAETLSICQPTEPR